MSENLRSFREHSNMAIPIKRRTTKKEKLQLAIQAREAVTSLVKKFGAFAEIPGLSTPPLQVDLEPYKIFYRTPFQRLPESSENVKYYMALTGKVLNLPYALDIWESRRKILLFEWDDKGAYYWATFEVDKVRQFLAWAEELRY
jgi:hypothetical protein